MAAYENNLQSSGSELGPGAWSSSRGLIRFAGADRLQRQGKLTLGASDVYILPSALCQRNC